MPRLEIRRAERLSVQDIGDQPITVGRSSSNDVALLNLHVSRQHCVIERADDGNLRVRDLDSVSGTWVNGERVNECTLFMGDRISVGPFDLVLRAGDEETGLVSRNAALDAALSNVAIDEDTGVPVEGPSALILNLRREIDQQQKQHADALSQIAGLHRQIEQLTRQGDEAARMNERSLLLDSDTDGDTSRSPGAQADPWAYGQLASPERAEAPPTPDDRDEQIASLREQLDQQRARADAAEARVTELTAEYQSMRRSAEEWQTYAEAVAAGAGSSGGARESSHEVESLRRAAREAEQRAAELAAEAESLRSRARQNDDVAGQMAELEGTIEIERRRAQTAEARAAELEHRLEESARVVGAAQRAGELQGLLDVERDRVDSASARMADLESQVAEAARQREDDLAQIDSLSAALENTQQLLAEAQTSVEDFEADRHAAQQQLEEAEAELARWRSHGDDVARALETEQAHAADLNRALEEAWRKIEGLSDRLRAMEARIEEMEAVSAQAGERAAEALAEHMAEIERLTSTEADLRAQLEAAQSSHAPLDRTLAETRAQLETTQSSLRHALARADDMQRLAEDLRERCERLQDESRAAAERAQADLTDRDRRLRELQASEEGTRQRLNNLEATKYAASEKAERALKTLNVLHNQIRSLDEATAKVSDLQSRLAQVEAAWVQTDELQETRDPDNEHQLQAAGERRLRIVEEMDALNKARDAAVASLRDSAKRLRSLSERETPVLMTTIPQGSQDPNEPAPPRNGGSGRKWWKFGG